MRSAKEMLSDYEDAEVSTIAGFHATSLLVTRNEFDHVIAEQVRSARTLVVDTLRSAGVRPEDLHALYLTGGSSHVPAIHRGLSEVLGGRPATLGDPKLVVALGAHHVPAGVSGTIVEPVSPPSPSSPSTPSTRRPRQAPRRSGGEGFGAGDGPTDQQRGSELGGGRLQLLCPVQGEKGEVVTLKVLKEPGERVDEGEAIAEITRRRRRTTYTSPVTGVVRRLEPNGKHEVGRPWPGAVGAFTLAETLQRGLGRPASHTPQTEAVWQMLRALGADDDGVRCFKRLTAPRRQGGIAVAAQPRVTLLGCDWQVPGDPVQTSGVLVAFDGGAYRVAGGALQLPPFVVLAAYQWAPGDPHPSC